MTSETQFFDIIPFKTDFCGFRELDICAIYTKSFNLAI